MLEHICSQHQSRANLAFVHHVLSRLSSRPRRLLAASARLASSISRCVFVLIALVALGWHHIALASASLDAVSSAPNLASVSAVAIDLDSQELLFTQHADLQLPIASITKLMTAVVVLDSADEAGGSLDDWLEIRDWNKAQVKNAYSRIRLTSTAKRKDLVRIALMSSENRASFNLAQHHPQGPEAFVEAMNAKARALGMTQTSFVDSTGLSVGNRSTAQDLAKLIVLADKYPLIREWSTTRQYTVNFRKPRYRLGYGNTNPLTSSKRWQVELSKTGYLTEAGRCLVMVAHMNERRIGVVLLNSLGTRSPLGDAGRIKRWLTDGSSGKVAAAASSHRERVLGELGLGGG